MLTKRACRVLLKLRGLLPSERNPFPAKNQTLRSFTECVFRLLGIDGISFLLKGFYLQKTFS